MKAQTVHNRAASAAILALGALPLVGCGSGGGGGSSAERTLQFGPLTTRVAGTIRPPVTSGGSGAVVTGVAGGNVTGLTLTNTALTLANTRIAFARHSQIYVMNADGSGQTNLSNSQTTDDDLPAWSPFVKTRTLLGTGGSLGTAAAGFLFGQQGKAVTGVVAFDTASPTTRVNARIAAQTGLTPGLPNLLFSITTSDSLKSLSYTNGFDAPARTVGVLNATGALVSFDASDGMVASVLPYTANRSVGAAPTTRREGSVLVYRGSFLGVWDAQGKNLASGGASEVRIDARTGRIVSFR